MLNGTFYNDNQEQENILAEEDDFSYFIKLDDVKCAVANIGITHKASELTFISVRDWA